MKFKVNVESFGFLTLFSRNILHNYDKLKNNNAVF